jgi:hypothetical protein
MNIRSTPAFTPPGRPNTSPPTTGASSSRLAPLRRWLPWIAAGALGLAGCSSTQAPDTGAPVPAAPASPSTSASALGTSPALQTAAEAKLQQQVRDLFSGYEHIVTKDELAKLGDSAQLTKALESLYRDPATPANVRVNALASLRFFPSPEVKALYEQTLAAPETGDDVRRSAVKAYGAGFGREAVPVLSKMLEHPELHTRNAAVKTLGAIADDKAVIALREHLAREQAPLVKSSIEDVLAKVEGKVPAGTTRPGTKK